MFQRNRFMTPLMFPWVVVGMIFFGGVSPRENNVSGAVVAAFDFEGNLNSSSGGANAVSRGSPQFINAIHGQGLLVNSGNYAAIAVPHAFVPGLKSFSAALRFKITGLHPVMAWAPLLSMQGNDFSEGAILQVSRNDGIIDGLRLGLHDGSAYEQTDYRHSTSLKDAWHHAAYVVNRATSQVSLYLDGLKVANRNLGLGSIDPSFDYLLGQYDFVFARNGHPRFVGGHDMSIDEVYLYDHALEDSDVALLSAGPQAVPEPSTIACCIPLAIAIVRRRLGRRRLGRLPLPT
jgi:Concanavalin A-like lectin/glucanases superfamily